jgi:hypothetical protein
MLSARILARILAILAISIPARILAKWFPQGILQASLQESALHKILFLARNITVLDETKIHNPLGVYHPEGSRMNSKEFVDKQVQNR